MPTVDDSSGKLTLTMKKEAAGSATSAGCYVGANTHLLAEMGPSRLDEADEDGACESGKLPANSGDEEEVSGEAAAAGDEELACPLPEHLRVNYVCQVTKDARDAMAKYDCSGREVLMFCAILFLGGVSLGLTIGLVQSGGKLESGHYLLHACKDLKAEYRRLLDGYERNVSTEASRRLERQLATDKDYVQLQVANAEPASPAVGDVDEAAALDWSVDPCSDLHRHACAAWEAANPTPDFRRGRGGGGGSWSVYDAVEYRAKRAAHGVLLQLGGAAEGRPLRRLYRRCLRWRAGDPEAAEPRPWQRLRSLLTAVDEAADEAASLERLFGLVHLRLRLDSFVTLYEAPSLVDSTVDGLYLDIRVRQAQLPHRTVLSICRAFRLCRLPHCSDELAAIDRVERIYSTILSGNESLQFSDPLDSRAELITIEQLSQHLPQLRWDLVFEGDTLGKRHLYADLSFIRLIGQLMRRVDRGQLRTFLLWSMARTLYPFVSRAAFDEMAAVGRPRWPHNQGAVPDWIWCLDRMPAGPVARELQASELGSSLNGRRQLVILLGRRVRAEWVKKLIQTGISIDSRLLDKIQRIDIGQHIGWAAADDESTPAPALTGSWPEANNSFFSDVVRLLLMVPTSVPSQESSQLQVNAFYNRQQNSIQVSMANFQPPFFTADGPDYVNFAGLGSVFGHEIFHSIDSMGHRFSANGSRLNLLGRGQRSLEAAQPLIKLCTDHLIGCDPDQLSELSDESLADQFGLVMALSAFQEAMSHLSEAEVRRQNRLFFLAFAQSNCGYEDGSDSTGPPRAYPPWKDRVNKPVQQLRQFYQAFNCTVP